MRPLMFAAISLLALFTVSCEDADPNFSALQKQSGLAREEKFEKFSLLERFRLYNKIYENSRHPHDAELAVGFRDKPSESLKYIADDLRDSNFSDFLKYMPILYDLGQNTQVDVCHDIGFQDIQDTVRNYDLSTLQESAIAGLDFGGCKVVG